MKRKFPGIWFLVSFAASLTFLQSCSYRRKNEEYSATATVTPHFSSISARIIQPKCLPCHASGGPAENVDFTTYAGVFRRIRGSIPESSSFYTEVESGSMPQYRPQLDDDELLAIYQWIQNGAPND